MSDIVIKVENLSKQYRLGQVGTGTISHDVNRWWHTIRGKEDPYLKIGEENDRTTKGDSEYVWALKDINFEVKQGEVLGIIGRNGAGKSTLLKILSRTTMPTTGNIKIKGRIASLLEVGTGFHPELSGRDNIFLNGAILGMTKMEIKRKFDEIVDFAGVEKYIDTPVKRYSSGMYVRLAFGVAAHLEPEILIVDEVLAVGDAEFQKKALGKMKDVSTQDGRTVLFVSHNMGAIKMLCDRGLYLENGTTKLMGDTESVLSSYLVHSARNPETPISLRDDKVGNKHIEVIDILFKNGEGIASSEFFSGDEIKIEINFINHKNIPLNELIVACGFSDKYENRIVSWVSDEMKVNFTQKDKITLHIPKFNVRSESYFFNYQISHKTTAPDDFCDALTNAASLTILETDFFNSGKKIRQGNSLLLEAYFE